MDLIIEKIKNAIRRPFTYPGGYNKTTVMLDGGILCIKCTKDNYRNIVHSTMFNYRDCWEAIDIDIVWEGEVNCSHCHESVTVY